MRLALIVVDVQYDFMPGGSLPVPNGTMVIGPINELLAQKGWHTICATQDYHPADHVSFLRNHEQVPEFAVVEWKGQTQKQQLWAVHCVQGTRGCELHESLNQSRIEKVFHKGYNSRLDSYSGFADSFAYEETGLDDFLRRKKIDRIYVCGLAEDYCVFHTAVDAARRGYETCIVEGAVKGINPLSDAQRNELARNKVTYQTRAEVLNMLQSSSTVQP